jgi:hypothetical protein
VDFARSATRYYHLLAGLKFGSGGFEDRSSKIDARHHREGPRNAGLPGDGEPILIIQARTGDTDQDIAGRKRIRGEILKRPGSLTLRLAQHKSTKSIHNGVFQ